MNFLSGYKTYLGLLVALVPTVIDIVQTGISTGQSKFVIAGTVIAAIGRYLAQPK